jgi:signal transduction histidine kinase
MRNLFKQVKDLRRSAFQRTLGSRRRIHSSARWFRLISLRLQIILLVLAFTLAVGLGNTLRAHLALEALAQEQFERRSVATATALAIQAAEPVLTNDLFGLYELINDALVNTAEMRYVLVLDLDGGVRAHTFGTGVPRGLVEANAVAPDERWHVRRLRTEEGTIVDVAVPLEGQAGTLRLGMSEKAIAAAVDRHTMELLGLTAMSLLPVLALTYILGRALTQPLLKLVEVTRAIGQGDLSRQAPVEGRDEVAQLGAAFNAMTRDLARSRQALESSNQALQDRNEELAALYAVATAMAQAESADSLVRAALDKALDVMALKAGWVLLETEDSPEGVALRAARGLLPDMVQQMKRGLPPGCALDSASGLKEAVIAHAGGICPWFEAWGNGLQTMCHAAVPLRSRTRLWGIMHLACPDPGCFTPHRLGLLTALGQQVGMAIENVHLAEAQRRETFRRRLLDQVMAAQEEERKRIARELHDELAQSLTVLIRDLEGITGRMPANQAQLKDRIRDTRSLAVRILEQTRRLIFDLRPTALDDLGLLPAIRRYAQRRLEVADIQLHMEALGQARRLPSEVETSVFRIAQEAITNVVRHAHASQVHLSLNFDPDRITLTVTDDGVGFDPAAILEAPDSTRCLGLLGMRERAELLGGRLSIESRPGAGTTVHLRVPLRT